MSLWKFLNSVGRQMEPSAKCLPHKYNNLCLGSSPHLITRYSGSWNSSTCEMQTGGSRLTAANESMSQTMSFKFSEGTLSQKIRWSNWSKCSVVEPGSNWCIHNTTALPEARESFQKRDQKDHKTQRNGKEVCCEIVSPKYIRNCTHEVLASWLWHRSCTRVTLTDTAMWKGAGSSWNFQYRKNYRQPRNACSGSSSLSHGKAWQLVFNNRWSFLKAYT